MVSEESMKLMDAADEQFIVEEVKGKIVKPALVYEVEGEWCISLYGLRELARELAEQGWDFNWGAMSLRHIVTQTAVVAVAIISLEVKIPVLPVPEPQSKKSKRKSLNSEPKPDVSPKFYTLPKVFGAAQQLVMDKNYYDSFAIPKVVAKAQRNALRAAIPFPYQRDFIERHKQEIMPIAPPNHVEESRPADRPPIEPALPEPPPTELSNTNITPTDDILNQSISYTEITPIELTEFKPVLSPDERKELYRQLYRTGRRLWGDGFHKQLRILASERYDAPSLSAISDDQLQDFVAYLNDLIGDQ